MRLLTSHGIPCGFQHHRMHLSLRLNALACRLSGCPGPYTSAHGERHDAEHTEWLVNGKVRRRRAR